MIVPLIYQANPWTEPLLIRRATDHFGQEKAAVKAARGHGYSADLHDLAEHRVNPFVRIQLCHRVGQIPFLARLKGEYELERPRLVQTVQIKLAFLTVNVVIAEHEPVFARIGRGE